jgi:hypothetical protein
MDGAADLSPRAVVVNPQNAVEDFGPTRLEEVAASQEMLRVGGVLMPVSLARAKAQHSEPGKKCQLCMRGGSIRATRTSEGLLRVTVCEVKQHNVLTDCWITCKGSVYDASAFMREDVHPGGERAFARRAGGVVDCSEDYAFHSAKGRRLWSKYLIAVVVACDDPGEPYDAGSGCIIS